MCRRGCGRVAAFTLIELLVVVAIIALLISILLPSLSKAREASRKAVCGRNVKSFVDSCKTYAFDNRDEWPSAAGHSKIATPATLTNIGGATTGGAIARDEEGKVDGGTPPAPSGATIRQCVTTRSMWLLVRRGQMEIKNFICPSADDVTDNTADTLRFYDFRGYGYLSYGYQMPHARAVNSCRPRENVDPRMVLYGDRSPGAALSENPTKEYAVPPSQGGNDVPAFNAAIVGGGAPAPNNVPLQTVASTTLANEPAPCNGFLCDTTPAQLLKPFNSPNHGGRGQGTGQNVGRADGSVDFSSSPLAGVDKDNIYSIQLQYANNLSVPRQIWTGAYPGTTQSGQPAAPIPGFHVLAHTDSTTGRNSSTDTALWP